MMHELGRRPDIQAELRAEAQSIPELDAVSMPKLTKTYDAFREVLRLHPPVRAIPRRTLKDTEIHGFKVPAQTPVWITPDVNHRDETIWSDPWTFDPSRFAEPRAEHKKHRFAFIPFGGGAHTCLGLQFSELQVKALMHATLRTWEWRIEDGGAKELQFIPFVKPKDDLPLILTKIGP
jgi:cytochrome P450